MDQVKNNLMRIDYSTRIKDSENKNRSKDLVEASKRQKGV